MRLDSPWHDPRDRLRPLREFVVGMTVLCERSCDEAFLLEGARPLLSDLLADDRWLLPIHSLTEPGQYRQYLLHCDPLERFCVVSFAWGPGARTPVHDHTVWGLVGILRGAERCHEWDARLLESEDPGKAREGSSHVMHRGMIEAVSPTLGDWHEVSNAMDDQDSVSIHVYGGNIGQVRRHKLNERTGTIEGFVSGYSPAPLPNLWDPSA